ncbi:hypothetical protein HZS_3974 [Henneguya salminicola]|nr:hypothetical protein HZS_3974 [Henneguya salminicola]
MIILKERSSAVVNTIPEISTTLNNSRLRQKLCGVLKVIYCDVLYRIMGDFSYNNKAVFALVRIWDL